MDKEPDIAVKYIFRRPFWKDNVYGTGLTFTTGQVRLLPHAIALKFLRHTDTFEVDKAKTAKVQKEAKTEEERNAAAIEADKAQKAEQARLEQERIEREQKETDEAVEAAKKLKAEQAQREQDLHDLHDQLGQMNKEAVLRFAQEKFNTPLDKKHSVEQLRLEAKALVDRFGVT